MTMFTDIGFGLIFGVVFGIWSHQEPNLKILLIGICAALWPDIDFIVWILRKKKLDEWAHKHRELLHRPLIAIPTAWIIGRYYLGTTEAYLIATATTYHFIHDTIGHGWGIRWFWPLANEFLCYRSTTKIYPVSRLYAWTASEQDDMCRRFGNKNWAREECGSIRSRGLRNELFNLAIGLAIAIKWLIPF